SAWAASIASGSSASSCSSSISPTISSSTSSIVTSPATPPYSSITIAMWLRDWRNSRSSTLSFLDSGMSTAGRSSEWIVSGPLSATTPRSRSLASRMPRISSLSSPWTGKREWPDSTTCFIRSSSRASADRATICERGTITSPTLMSDTASAPSIIRRVSASIRPSEWVSRSSSTRSSRVLGSPEMAELSRSSQLRRFSGLFSGGSETLLLSSSDIDVSDRSEYRTTGRRVQSTGSGAAAQLPRQGGGGRGRGPGRAPAGLVGQQVGVIDPQPGQDLALELLHGLGLAVVAVVPAQQVQHAVHGEVGVVGGKRRALLAGLARDRRRAQHQVAQQRQAHARRQALGQVGREAEHVRGVVAGAVVAVERAAFAAADQADRQVGLADAPLQRGRGPLAERHRRRQALARDRA